MEELELKRNLIIKEIGNFYKACKRAFNLLNRLKNLELLGYSAKISSKTLLETIAYHSSDMQRINKFLKAEWGTNYQIFLETKKLSNFTDTIESLWG